MISSQIHASARAIKMPGLAPLAPDDGFTSHAERLYRRDRDAEAGDTGNTEWLRYCVRHHLI